MAAYTVRVALNDADWDDYDDLYGYMGSQGFGKTITSNDGSTYQLPDAEYNYEGSASRSDVLNKAKAAASKTNKKYSVFVTESKGRTWYNLDKA